MYQLDFILISPSFPNLVMHARYMKRNIFIASSDTKTTKILQRHPSVLPLCRFQCLPYKRWFTIPNPLYFEKRPRARPPPKFCGNATDHCRAASAAILIIHKHREFQPAAGNKWSVIVLGAPEWDCSVRNLFSITSHKSRKQCGGTPTIERSSKPR